MKETKITTIIGTRPELIRLSLIIKRLDELFEHRLVHTGQNSDPMLSEVFFKELQIRKPDLHLEIENSTLGLFLGSLLPEIEIEFENNPPDAVVILGDTNSALAGIIAKRKGIPIYHLEAGNRSFDSNVPEEINRRIVDHFSDFNLAYTNNAKENLLREGIHPRNISVTGSPLCEVISHCSDKINSSKILQELKIKSRQYFLVSTHRQENVDDPIRLRDLIQSLNEIAIKFNLPVVVSTHPRTKGKLDKLNLEINSLISFYQPFGFIDYCKLQKEARIVFSDSGSVSEESVILGFRAITIRDSMERPEALESGSVIMSGINKVGILKSIEVTESGPASISPPSEYLIADTSTRVLNFVTSTIYQHKFWSGLRNK
jgi:UDP-N-acetylglucosamine 2-epimerase (non-hydrolysing)